MISYTPGVANTSLNPCCMQTSYCYRIICFGRIPRTTLTLSGKLKLTRVDETLYCNILKQKDSMKIRTSTEFWLKVGQDWASFCERIWCWHWDLSNFVILTINKYSYDVAYSRQWHLSHMVRQNKTMNCDSSVFLRNQVNS
jgi:hypothetical protein